MRIAVINVVLSMSSRFDQAQEAFQGRTDFEDLAVHIVIRRSGKQEFHRLKSLDENQQMLALIGGALVLGYYRVPTAVMLLALTVGQLEDALMAVREVHEVDIDFEESVIERLLSASRLVEDPQQVPDGEEIWELCLSRERQEVHIPSGGPLDDLKPGKVIATCSAPVGDAEAAQRMIALEKARNGQIEEAKENLLRRLEEHSRMFMRQMGMEDSSEEDTD